MIESSRLLKKIINSSHSSENYGFWIMQFPTNLCKVSSGLQEYNFNSFSLLKQNLTYIFRVLYSLSIFFFLLFPCLGQYFQSWLFWVSQIVRLVCLWMVLIFKDQLQLLFLDKRCFLSIPWKKYLKIYCAWISFLSFTCKWLNFTLTTIVLLTCNT